MKPLQLKTKIVDLVPGDLLVLNGKFCGMLLSKETVIIKASIHGCFTFSSEDTMHKLTCLSPTTTICSTAVSYDYVTVLK